MEDFPVIPREVNVSLSYEIENIAKTATNNGMIDSEANHKLDKFVTELYKIPQKYIGVIREV